MKKTAIVYGSTTGNTEKAAIIISEAIGKEKVTLLNVSGISVSDIAACEVLIIGTSTWGYGDLQDDWDSFLPVLKKEDLSGKTIALFGTGDASAYSDTFVDAIGILYEELKNTGASFTGFCETDDYTFDGSKAVFNGKFAGLPLDEDNESEKTGTRISRWVASIKDILD